MAPRHHHHFGLCHEPSHLVHAEPEWVVAQHDSCRRSPPPAACSPVTPDDPKCATKKEAIIAAASKLSATALATLLAVAVLTTV